MSNNKFYNLSDAQLVNYYIQNNDEDALATLYLRYTATLFGMCMKYLKQEADAEDMVQSLYEKVRSSISNKPIENFGGWLYIMAKNSCINYLNKKGIIYQYNNNFSDFNISSESEIDNLIKKEKEIDRLALCIKSLSNEQQQAIELFYFKKMCYVEIAQSLKTQWGHVRSLLQNAKRNLKNCIESQEIILV